MMILLELQRIQVMMFSTTTAHFWQTVFCFFNFLDAIKEGDGMRLMRQYKYFILYCKADDPHSTKYSLECLYQFFSGPFSVVTKGQ